MKLKQDMTTITSSTSNVTFTTPVAPPTPWRQIQTQSELDHAVFKTPIEDLVNLWLARFGSEWVNKGTVVNDEFFEWAALRLRQAGRLEEHWLVSESMTVLRIVEK